MSKPQLVDPRDTSGLDVSGLLSPEHRARLDLLGPRYATFAGWRMKEGDDDPDDDPDDEPDDEPIELDPDDIIKVGDKEMKVSDLQRIASREKRQGRKSGQAALLKELGFDTVEAAKEALAGAKPKPAPKSKDDGDDEADERARQRETAAEARERKAAEKERKLDLRGALRDAGVSKDDLDDAHALLDRAVDAEYDDDDLEDAVEQLKTRRPALFGAEDDEEKPEPRRPRGQIPAGGPKRKRQSSGKTGWDRGRARAQRRWGTGD